MAEAEKAAKKAKADADPEAKRLVQTMGRALWSTYVTSDSSEKLNAEQKKASWQEHRKAYLHMAKGLVRRLKAQGVTLTQGEKPAKKAKKASGAA